MSSRPWRSWRSRRRGSSWARGLRRNSGGRTGDRNTWLRRRSGRTCHRGFRRGSCSSRFRSGSRLRRRSQKRRRRQDSRLRQLHQNNQKENPRHHRANKKQHDAVNSASQQPARDVPDDPPESQQNEDTANRTNLHRGALRRHSQFPPRRFGGHRPTLSNIIQAKRIGICATVACINHFARTFARCRFAHSATCSRIMPSTSAPKK